jgi:hypothetical protein
MSGTDLRQAALADALAAALSDPQPSWLTLTPQRNPPDELCALLDRFDAGARDAARAATVWLREQALGSHTTARTRLLLRDGAIAGYYALASAQVALTQADRKRLGVQPVRVPAALVAWIAKDYRVEQDGRDLLLHAAATARRAADLQATTVLVVDPFDAKTAAMWRQRYGFRRSAEAGERRRLWLALDAID